MGLGAQFFAPINTAVQNLNRQLNINADRDTARHQTGLRNLMAFEDQDLRRQASARADKQFALEQDRFAENRRRWEAGEELRNLQTEEAQLRVKAHRELHKPRAIDMGAFALSGEVLDKMERLPEVNAKISRIFGENARYDPATNQVLNKKTGQPIRRSNFQLRTIIPQLYGLHEAYSGPVSGREFDIKQLEPRLSELKSSLKGTGSANDPRHLTRNAETKRQIKEIEAEIASLKNPSLDTLRSEYSERLGRLNSLAAMTEAVGGDTQVMRLAIKDTQDRLDELNTAEGKVGDGKNMQQRIAVKLDAKGNVVASKVLNVPKAMQGGIVPERLDPEMRQADGWTWSKMYDFTKGMGEKGIKKWESAVKMMRNYHGKWDDEGQWAVTEGLERQNNIAMHGLSLFMSRFGDQMKDRQLPAAVSEIHREAKQLNLDLNNDLAALNEQYESGESKIQTPQELEQAKLDLENMYMDIIEERVVGEPEK